MKNNITEEELKKAVTEALVKPSIGFREGETTAPTEAKKHNIAEAKARRVLSELCERGVLERKMVKYTDPWGFNQRVKGYRLKGVDNGH
jgi:Fic family protein